METGRDDTAWVKVQLQELSNRWDTVCALSVTKQTRLQQALKQVRKAAAQLLSLSNFSPHFSVIRQSQIHKKMLCVPVRRRTFAQRCSCSWSGSQRRSRRFVSAASSPKRRRLCRRCSTHTGTSWAQWRRRGLT